MTRRPAGPSELAVSLADELSTLVVSENTSSFSEWTRRVPEPKAGPLDFRRFPFQRELYAKTSAMPEVVIKKAAQVGISAYLVRWVIYWADTHGFSALYVFPKKRQLADFSDMRVRALIHASPYLRSRVPTGGVLNKMLKQVGRGQIYFRGSETLDDLDGIDADILAFDEYDTLTHAHIPDAERRLGSSLRRMIRRVGVPSVPGYGISQRYDESDQRVWHVRCSACGEQQPITWENVDESGLRRVCRRCKRQRLDLSSGEWVATYADRSVRGYHVSRLMVPDTDMALMVAESKKREPSAQRAFHNKDLGQEFLPEGSGLTLAAIRAAQRDYPMPDFYAGNNIVTMGVDPASERNIAVRISEHLSDGTKCALFIGEVSTFKALDELMERYRVDMAAIEDMPERRSARGFANRFPGRVYLAHYAITERADPIQVDDDRKVAAIPRTEALDAVIQELRTGQNLLPRNLPPGYEDQLQSPARLIEESSRGDPRARYVKRGPDDYAHAEVYDLVAFELYKRDHLIVDARSWEDDPVEVERSYLDWDGGYSPGPRGNLYDQYADQIRELWPDSPRSEWEV